MSKFAKKKIIQAIKGETDRISFYRMIKSKDFEELCLLYWNGKELKNMEHFTALARKLERTFQIKTLR